MLSITALTSLFAVLEAKLLQAEDKVKVENSVADFDHYDAEHSWVRAGRQLTAEDLKQVSEDRKRKLEGIQRDLEAEKALITDLQRRLVEVEKIDARKLEDEAGQQTVQAVVDPEIENTEFYAEQAAVASMSSGSTGNNAAIDQFGKTQQVVVDGARRVLQEEFGVLPEQQGPVMEELRLHPNDPLEIFRTQSESSRMLSADDEELLDIDDDGRRLNEDEDDLDEDDNDFVQRQLAETHRAMNLWRNLEGSNSVPVNGDELKELAENRRRLAEATEFSDIVDMKPKKRSLMDREPVAHGPQQPNWFGAALNKMF